MQKVIVLGNDHTNTLGIVQTLGRSGFIPESYIWGINTGLVKASVHAKSVFHAKDCQTCVNMLLRNTISTSEKIPIIATCDDAALVLESNMSLLSGSYIYEYTQGDYSLSELAKKTLQVKLAEKSGFNVPKSWAIDNSLDIPEKITYPCLIKPLISCKGAKSDIRICKDEFSLRHNLNDLKYTKRIIIQQYIKRDYEISILGCGLKNNDCIIPCVENKLTLYPKYVGLECLANMQPLEDANIIESINSLIKLIKYVGVFSVEMMHCVNDDKFYFTEINLRNDGANSFIYKYGVNLPLSHINDLLSLPKPDNKNLIPGYYIWEMHHFQSLLHRDISLARWISEIKNSNGFLTYFKEDKKPFYKQFYEGFFYKIWMKELSNYK